MNKRTTRTVHGRIRHQAPGCSFLGDRSTRQAGLFISLLSCCLLNAFAFSPAAAEFPPEVVPHEWEEKVYRAFTRTRSTWPEEKRRELASFLCNLISASSFRYQPDQLDLITRYIREGATIMPEIGQGCYNNKLFEIEKEWWKWRAIDLPVLRWQMASEDKEEIVRQYGKVLDKVVATLEKMMPELPPGFLDRYRKDYQNRFQRGLEDPFCLSYHVPLAEEQMKSILDMAGALGEGFLQTLERADRASIKNILKDCLERWEKAVKKGDGRTINLAYGLLERVLCNYLWDGHPGRALEEYSRLSATEIPSRLVELIAGIAEKDNGDFTALEEGPGIQIPVETDIYLLCRELGVAKRNRTDSQDSLISNEQIGVTQLSDQNDDALVQLPDESNTVKDTSDDRKTLRHSSAQRLLQIPAGIWWLGTAVGLTFVACGCYFLIAPAHRRSA